MLIRYSGRHTAVDLMLPGGPVRVEKNGRVEVPDDVGNRLIAGPNWRSAGGSRSRQEPELEPEQDTGTETVSEPESVEIEQES